MLSLCAVHIQKGNGDKANITYMHQIL